VFLHPLRIDRVDNVANVWVGRQAGRTFVLVRLLSNILLAFGRGGHYQGIGRKKSQQGQCNHFHISHGAPF